MTNIQEIFIPVPDYEDYYLVSNLGNVKSLHLNRLLKTYLVKGYPTIGYRDKSTRIQKNLSVHSLVMRAFVGVRPSGLVINHIDGNRSNNMLCNLEYCTQSENKKKDFISGRQDSHGEKQSRSKMTNNDIYEIIFLRDVGKISCNDIAKIYKVKQGAIHHIFNGYRWSHLTGIYNGHNR